MSTSIMYADMTKKKRKKEEIESKMKITIKPQNRKERKIESFPTHFHEWNIRIENRKMENHNVYFIVVVGREKLKIVIDRMGTAEL